MTDLLLSDTLWSGTTEILEKMFFVDASEIETSAGEGGITAALTFEGDPPGALWVCLTPGAARALAADFLSVEPSCLSPHQIEAVVCELANMICGSVLSRVESSSDFRLSEPRIVAAAPTAPPMASRTVALAGGFLTVGMRMESAAWPASAKFES